ncbi:MAG: hypothetical protein ABF242_00465 [Flavobacteriales bacterium]
MRNLLVTISLLILFACTSQTDKAITYNNALLGEQQFVANRMEEYLMKLKDSSETHTLTEFKNEILVNIEKSKSKIKELKVFQGDSTFSESVTSVLTSYASSLKNEYEEVAKFMRLPDSLKTLDKKLYAEKHAVQADELISEKEDYFINLQEKFAKEHGFQLSNP